MTAPFPHPAGPTSHTDFRGRAQSVGSNGPNQRMVANPPHSDEAERAVLGAILLNNLAFGGVQRILAAGDLFCQRHQRIFRAMERLSERGTKIDLVTIKDELGRQGGLEAAGGPAYISSLVDGVPRSTNVDSYARIVKQKANLRALIGCATGIQHAASGEGSVEQILATAFESLSHIRGRASNSVLVPLDLSRLHEVPEDPPYVLPGWFCHGDLAGLVAEGGKGKSNLVMDLAVAAANCGPFLGLHVEGAPLRVLMVDAENSSRLIARRLRRLALGRGIDLAQVAAMPLRYLTASTLDLDDPGALAELLSEVKEFRPDLITVDSLIRFHRRKENDNAEMAAFIADRIRPLQRHGATVILLHHLRKPSRDAGNEMQHRVRGAGDLFNACDSVMGLEANREGGLTLTSLKPRWGQHPAPISLRFEDVDEVDGFRVVATDPDTTFGVVRALLQDRGSRGALRADVIEALRGDGTDAETARTMTTRHLGKLFHTGQAVKAKDGKAMRYWLAEHGPAGAEKGTRER